MSFLSRADQKAVELEYGRLRRASLWCRLFHRWSRWTITNSGDVVSRAFWLHPDGRTEPTNEVVGKWWEYRRECCGCGLVQTKYERESWGSR